MSDTAQEGYVALGLQTARGAAASTTTLGMRVTSADISGQTENLVVDPEIGGTRDTDTAGVALGTFNVGGSLEAYLRSTQLGYLLLAAGFEEVPNPTQDATTGAYTHVFTPASDFRWLTVESSWGKNRAVRRFRDCLVNELAFSVSGNEFATYTADILGLSEEWRATPSVPVYPATDPVAHYRGSSVTLDGLGTYRFTETELTIANNLSDDEAVIGSRELVDLTPGAREVTGSGTIRLDGAAPQQVTDLYRAAMYGSKTGTSSSASDEPYHTSATVRFGSRKLVGTSTTLRYGLEVEMPDVVVSAFPLESSGADVIEASIEWRAFAGAQPVSTIRLINARATKYVTP